MIIKPSSADSMKFSLMAFYGRAHYNGFRWTSSSRSAALAARLEGWPPVIAVHPSFVLREPQDAVLPTAPQDEVRLFSRQILAQKQCKRHREGEKPKSPRRRPSQGGRT